jgi:hypothetical protein
MDEVGDIYLAGGTTSGGSQYPGSAPMGNPQHSQYYHNADHNGLAEPPNNARSDVYVNKIDAATGGVVMGTFYGGRGGVPVNWPNYSQDGDMVTSLRTRHARLYLTGATASYWSFPVNALDGNQTSFLQYIPPTNQIAGTTDITHGFIAQLSWLHAPVGIAEVEAAGAPILSAWFHAEDGLSIQLPTTWAGTPPVVDLFDAQGRLVASQRAAVSGTRLELTVSSLAPGIYAGRVHDTRNIFKVFKP